MMEVEKALGNKLRKIRKNRGLTQLQLSAKLNIDQSKMSDIENGKRVSIYLEELVQLATTLNVTLDELFEIDSASKDDELERLTVYYYRILTDDYKKIAFKIIKGLSDNTLFKNT